MLTKTIIRDLAQKNDYLRRWSLWLPFGWTLKLHQIVRADDDRCSHDHPWWFVRIILWGGYLEQFGTNNETAYRLPWRPWAPWRIYWCGPGFRHRIVSLNGPCSWTLALCGPNSGVWGFFTRAGWMFWRRFVSMSRENRVLWCDDGRQLAGFEWCPDCGCASEANEGRCDDCYRELGMGG